jgi:hypothetical protein
MSLTAHFINHAAAKAAKEAARRLEVRDWTARKLAPIAVSLVLHGLRRRTATIFGAAALSFTLSKYEEDLIVRAGRRFGDADVRARGEAFLDRALGRHRLRSVQAIADLASIDMRTATAILAMTAAATLSALSKARRDLKLGVTQLQGVLKSESAGIDYADPRVVKEVRNWVFRPSIFVRLWSRAQALLAPRPAREIALAK